MIARTFLRLLHAYLSGHVKAAGTLTNVPRDTGVVGRSWHGCALRQKHLSLVGTVLKKKKKSEGTMTLHG